MKIENYLMHVILAIDQLGNAMIGGDHDETISGTLGKMLVENKLNTRPFAEALAYLLNRLDEDHCLDAIEFDRGKTFQDMFGIYIHHRADGLH